MTSQYEIQMSLIVVQESRYQMKYIFEQLRKFYNEFYCSFVLKVNTRF